MHRNLLMLNQDPGAENFSAYKIERSLHPSFTTAVCHIPQSETSDTYGNKFTHPFIGNLQNFTLFFIYIYMHNMSGHHSISGVLAIC